MRALAAVLQLLLLLVAIPAVRAETLAEVALGTMTLTGAPALVISEETLTVSPGAVRHALRLHNPTDVPLTATLSVTLEDHRLAQTLGYRVADAPGGPQTTVSLTRDGESLPLDQIAPAMLVQGQDITWALEAAGLVPKTLYDALAASDETPPPDDLTAAVREALAVVPTSPGIMDLQPAVVRSVALTVAPGARHRLALSYTPLRGALPIWRPLVAGEVLPALADAFCLEQVPDRVAWQRRQRAWQRSMDGLGAGPHGPEDVAVIGVLGGAHEAQQEGALTVRLQPDHPGGLIIGCTPVDWQTEPDGTRVLSLPASLRPLPLRLGFADPGGIEGLIPDSDERRLVAEDVQRLLERYDRTVLRYARNEIFARRGYIFNDPALQRYFARQPWYRPVSPDVQLDAVERENVLFLVRFEQGR